MDRPMKLMAQADVVIALGSRMGPFGTLPQHGMDYWPKDAKIIQVEADHTNLGLVKKITVGIHGDAKAVAKELLKRLADRTLACDATKAERAATGDDEHKASGSYREAARAALPLSACTMRAPCRASSCAGSVPTLAMVIS